MIENLDNTEIEETFLLIENGSLMGKITGNFRFVMDCPILEKLKSENDEKVERKK